MSNEKEQSEGRVNPTNELPKNPSEFFLNWKSKEKKFVYYDKKNEKDVSMPFPLEFIPLFKCVSIRGYNHKKTKTYISNEIKDLNTDYLVVNSYNNVTKERKKEWAGYYAEIKENLDQNCKFTVSLYAAIKRKKGGMALVNFQLNGAGLHHWFDFERENNIWKGSIKVSKMTQEKNGDVDYNAPVYEIAPISKEDDIEAARLQKVITAHLNEYFARNASSTPSTNQDAPKSSKNEHMASTKEVEQEEDSVNWGTGDDNEEAPW